MIVGRDGMTREEAEQILSDVGDINAEELVERLMFKPSFL
jgi:hypothetical protein